MLILGAILGGMFLGAGLHHGYWYWYQGRRYWVD